ncbi:MAG: aspartate aminotransferase family protein [Ardenticatenales bacterium]|nr:aspartate aminotransferase family protein [Ardenticatenales bacterium]
MEGEDKALSHLRSEGDLNLSPRRATWTEQNLDPETQQWLAEDARYFLHQSLSTPCLNVLQGCQGSYIEDLQGNRLLDFHGNNVHQVGFGHPRVIEAIIAQLHSLSFCTRRYTNLPAIQLAKKLAELAPGNLNKVLFAPGGSSAIGMALKLARMATGRFKTLSFWDSFHGASLDAISIGGEAIFRKGIGPLLPGTEHVPPPDPQHCLWDCGGVCDLRCARYVEYVLEKEGDVAAVIAETVRSTPYIPPPGYWETVRAACDRHGALLILDEIPHCLGRTGKMFSCQHYDVVPDMLVIGKGLGGGIFPLAALIARETLDVAADRALGHYTHEKNPVACAAGLATIEILEEEGLIEHAREMGEYALEQLRARLAGSRLVGDIRGLGLLMGIELSDGASGTRATDAAEAVMYRALARGLNFKVTMGNIITLTPPLTITREEMDEALAILVRCLAEVEAETEGA